MKNILCLLTLLGITTSGFSQNYDVALIPKELKAYAKAIIRVDDRKIIINSNNDMVYRVKRAYTILNKSGEEFAEAAIGYDKSRKIKYLSLNIYNENGALTGKVKSSDFKDRSHISDFSLFEDDRIKTFNPVINTYPVTVELEFELKMNQTFIIPDWYPQPQDDVSVQQASLEIIKDPSFIINYKSHQIQNVPEIKVVDKKEVLTWKVENIEASKSESYSVSSEERLPYLKLSPVKFTYEGISGEFKDWNSYGKWVYDNLLKGRDELPLATQESIKNLIKDAKTKKEAAKIIYEYVQKKNRYISVQVGIGGFRPMKAAEVDALAYGDCKALTNYTAALLKVADIDSYYTEIYAGFQKVNYLKDFTSGGQGNHIILCVPFGQDTTWLECTSKNAPFGFLGSFTQDRYALVIKESGGYITKTPAYTWNDNLQVRSAKFDLNESGKITGNIKTHFSGLQYENREDYYKLTPTEKESQVKSAYSNIPDFRILSYALNEQRSEIPKYEEILDLESAHFANVQKEYYQFDINPLNVNTRSPKDIMNRRNELYINIGYTDIDSIHFKIPKGYKIENLPQGIKKEYDFGSYEIKSFLRDEEIFTIRKVVIKEGRFPAAAYQDFFNFHQTASRYDKAKCILVKKN